MLFVILKAKKLLGRFMKKNSKTHQKEFRVEKVIKSKDDMLVGKARIIILIVGLIKKT